MFVHKDSHISKHVFIRTDRVKKPLKPSFDGPFQVFKRYEKFYTLNVKDKGMNLSLDRLKPAYLLLTIRFA